MSNDTKVLNNQRPHISIKAKEHMNIRNTNVNLDIHLEHISKCGPPAQLNVTM